MRRLLRKIIQILDGTPAEYGSRDRGQSVAELALVTPILIVLIMGLAEIGWFANNYMILLEVTRVGARFGTVQTGQGSPLAWNNDASLVPGIPGPPGTDLVRARIRNCDEVSRVQELQGFYSLLTCVMLRSMDPLEFKLGSDPAGNAYPDDIVISAFALQLIVPQEVPVAMRANLASVDGIDDELPRVLVVGRYPTNANECTLDENGNPFVWDREPFDYIQDGVRTYILRKNPDGTNMPDIDENRIYLELIGADPFNPADENTYERQRGFVYAGQHYMGGTGVHCLGSEWSIAEVERLVNLPSFLNDEQVERARLASMGMVLVEMFWRHDLLLKNPVFNPVFTILGDNTIISVWAAFPVPAVEPRIRFP